MLFRSIVERIEFIDNVQKGLPVNTINPPVTGSKAVELTPEKEAKLRNIYQIDGAVQ